MSELFGRPSKRRKTEEPDLNTQSPITHADQLHQWTKFQQSTDPAVKSDIVAFKNYLASISHLGDVAQRSKQFRILKEYCEWQKAPSDDQIHFHDLISTWSFAVDNNAEAITSAVPAALAQLLKAISGTLEFQDFGLALIDSLLRREQSKLFEKCLASPRSKPHLASPCLRLLTEMISFGAGARIDEFWTRRDLVMYKFEALLEQHNSDKQDEERRKPSVRRMALRLLLAMLKYLDAGAKADLLIQGRALHTCLHGLPFDGHDVVVDILQSIEKFLVDDKDVPRECLVTFFKASRLEYLSSLYRFDVVDDAIGAMDAVREAVQKLLERICTTREGVLLPQNDWYPFPAAALPVQSAEDDYIDLGLESWHYEDSRRIPVSNMDLSAFIQKLRHDDPLQSSLLLNIFRAAPELVAEYFSKPQNQKAPTPNSDDAVWRAHFAFLFSAIESPVPRSTFEWSRGPPLPRMVVESIVPRPLDRAYISNKLLASRDEILKVSGARLLTTVMKKLDTVLNALAQPSTTATKAYMYQQASEELLELVEARIPTARDVSLALQRASKEEATSYGNLLESLYHYHRSLPHLAATNTFDIGPIMADLCARLEDDPDDLATLLDQLSHCVQIADMSSSTKWLHKASNEAFSPLSRLLKVAVANTARSEVQAILRILRKVLTYRGILSPGPSAFAALCSSLIPHQKFSPSPDIFLFLDNCITRTNQKPVKYLDEIEHLSQLVSDGRPLSLLVGAVAEQWVFACKKYEGHKSAIKNIAAWVARFLALLDAAAENYRVMIHFQEGMLNSSTSKFREYLQDALEKVRKKPVSVTGEWKLQIPAPSHDENQGEGAPTESPTLADGIGKLLAGVVKIPESLTGLDKWSADFDIELEIETHRLNRLLLCIASSDEEIRLHAFQILQRVTHLVDTSSSHPLKRQVYLVLGEVTETILQHGTVQALPAVIPELADALLRIMARPVHSLYPKVNRFLLLKPSWPAKRVVVYWINRILHREPDDADSWTPEVEWLLHLLLKGLRSQVDLDLYRRTGLWEEVLSLYSSPVLTQANKRLILALLYAACSISAGVDMLWTRFGVYSWLTAMELTDKENEKQIRLLREKMEKECTKDVIEAWKIACPLTRTGQ